MRGDTGFVLEGGDRSILLAHDVGAHAAQLLPLAGTLQRDGLTVSVPELFRPGAPWTTWLHDARAAFMGLRSRHVSVSVCGFGAGIPLALLLAAEYAADHLVLVPADSPRLPLRDRFSLRALERCAERNVFVISATAVVLSPEGASLPSLRQARRLSRMLSRCDIISCPQESLSRTITRLFLNASACSGAY